MNKIAIAILAVAAMGCSPRSENPSQTPKAALLILDLDRTGKWQTYGLPDATAEMLRRIVAAPPDHVDETPTPLEPIYMVEIDGASYALDPDELLFRNVRRWKSPGIQEKLLNIVRKE